MTHRCLLALGCLILSLFGPAAIAAPPANDNFANATVMDLDTGTLTQSTAEATREVGEPEHLGNSTGASVWFSWQATADGALQVSTAGSDFDTILAVYQGADLASLTELASNDDIGFSVTSQVRIVVTAGATYWIAVDGFEAATGALTLNWEPVAPPTLPEIATGAVSDLGRSRFTIAINLLSTGDSLVTIGVCMSTTPGPTFEDSVDETEDALLGEHIIPVIGLAAGTQYFVRAYATNEVGVAYGDEVTVTTLPRQLLQFRVSGTVSDLGGGTEISRKVSGVLLTANEEKIAVLLLTWKEGKTKRYQVQDWRDDLSLHSLARLKQGEQYAVASARELFTEDIPAQVRGFQSRQFNGKTSAVKLSKEAAAQNLPKLLKGGEVRLDQGGAKLGRSTLTARLDTKATAALQASRGSFDAALAALLPSFSTGATLAPEAAFGTGTPAAPDHAGILIYRWRSNDTDYGLGTTDKYRDDGYLAADPRTGEILEAFYEVEFDDEYWYYDAWTEEYTAAFYQASGKRNAKQEIMAYGGLTGHGGILNSVRLQTAVGKMTPRVDLGGGLRGTIAKSLNGQYFRATSDTGRVIIGSYTLRLDVKETKYANEHGFDVYDYMDELTGEFDF